MTFDELMNFLSAIGWIPSCIGLWFVWRQIRLMREQNQISKDNVKRDKAIEFAKQYADLLSSEFGFCYGYLSNIIPTDYNKKVSLQSIKHFDKQEMQDLLKQEEIKAIIDSCTKPSKKQMSILSEMYIAQNELPEDEISIIRFLDYCGWEIEKEEVELLKKEIRGVELDELEKTYLDAIKEKMKKINYFKTKIIRYLNNSRVNSLNKLEYMCMYFYTNMADDDIVYRSLHQSFLSTITLLYVFIANLNETSSNKYYTNIIFLFNRWKRRYIQDSRIEKNVVRSVCKRSSKYE